MVGVSALGAFATSPLFFILPGMAMRTLLSRLGNDEAASRLGSLRRAYVAYVLAATLVVVRLCKVAVSIWSWHGEEYFVKKFNSEEKFERHFVRIALQYDIMNFVNRLKNQYCK